MSPKDKEHFNWDSGHLPQSGGDYVDLSSAQTIGGIKTFTSIPVLPASNPTADNEAARKAYIDGLIPPVKIVAVKSEVFTGTMAVSCDGYEDFAITDLSIAHALANSANKLLMLGQVGVVAGSNDNIQVGTCFMAGSTKLMIGDARGNRSRVGAGGIAGYAAAFVSWGYHISGVYEPGTTDLITYSLRGINIRSSAQTVYINRTEDDTDAGTRMTGACTFTIIEYGA